MADNKATIAHKLKKAVAFTQAQKDAPTYNTMQKLTELKHDNALIFDYKTGRIQGMSKSEAMRCACSANNLKIKDITNKVQQVESSKQYRAFSVKFYEVMSQSGYKKMSPEKLAMYYNKLESIALADYVEPRDNINALKLLLSYNDMDVSQMQVLASNNSSNQASGEIKEAIQSLRDSLKSSLPDRQAINVTPQPA